jgi:hypothetical protein
MHQSPERLQHEGPGPAIGFHWKVQRCGVAQEIGRERWGEPDGGLRAYDDNAVD